jgi:hypothetical protein
MLCRVLFALDIPPLAAAQATILEIQTSIIQITLTTGFCRIDTFSSIKLRPIPAKEAITATFKLIK